MTTLQMLNSLKSYLNAVFNIKTEAQDLFKQSFICRDLK